MQEEELSAPEEQPSTPDIDAWLAANVVDDEPGEAAQEAPSEPEEESIEEVEEPSPEPQGRTPEAEKAVRFLKLQGFPESMLNAASNEDLVAAHQHRVRNEADVTRAFQENAELRRRVQELEAAAGPGEPTADEPGELPEGLTEALGEEGAKALVAYLQAQRSQAPRELEEIRSLVPQLQEMVSSGVEERVKAELRGQFPEIDTRYKEVFAAYQQLAQTSLHGDLEGGDRAKALFLDAARMLGLGSQSPNPAPTPKPNGVTSARPTGRTREPKKLEGEERADRILAAITSGEVNSAEEIRARFGG